MPQLIGKAHYEVLIEFLLAMQGSKAALVRTADDADTLSRLGTNLLTSAISATDYYIPITTRTVSAPSAPGYPLYGAPKGVIEQVPSPALALFHLQTCFATGNGDSTGRVVERLTDFSKVPSDVAQMRASTVLLPLIPPLRDLSANGGSSSAPDPALVGTLVRTVLSSAISATDFYTPITTLQPQPQSQYYGSHQQKEPVPSPALALSYIKTCLDTENEALVISIVEKLLNRDALEPPARGQQRAATVLPPMVPLVSDLVKTRSPESAPVPGLDRLYRKALQLYISSPRAPAKADFEVILQAVILGGEIEELEKTYVIHEVSTPM